LGIAAGSGDDEKALETLKIPVNMTDSKKILFFIIDFLWQS